jgi:hypothetical protein
MKKIDCYYDPKAGKYYSILEAADMDGWNIVWQKPKEHNFFELCTPRRTTRWFQTAEEADIGLAELARKKHWMKWDADVAPDRRRPGESIYAKGEWVYVDTGMTAGGTRTEKAESQGHVRYLF